MPVKLKNIPRPPYRDGDRDRSASTTRLIELMAKTEITVVALTSIHPNPKNTKKHGARQTHLIAKNIEAFSFHTPIITDEAGMILCGHGRYQAARLLGLDRVPTIILRGLSEHEKQALAISDNRLPQLGEYDLPLISQTIAQLYELDLEFDPSILGYDTVEIDNNLCGAPAKSKPDRADQCEHPAAAQRAVSRIGDVWLCGAHKVTCGDALSNDTYDALMGHELAQTVFQDPPYNVRIKGHVSGRSGVREFTEAHGEMTSEQFTEFLGSSFAKTRRYVLDGAVIFICMDWRHLVELQQAAEPVFGSPKNLIVWVKNNGGMGTFYRSQHEFILPFVAGDAPPINNFGLGAKGRYRTNVWQYPGLSSFGRGRDDTLAMHPTVKPVALVADALMDCSHRRGIVLDPFGGSGTTMIAAERTGRVARLIEIDPLYCDVIVRRWEKFTGQQATLAGSDQTFRNIQTAGNTSEEA